MAICVVAGVGQLPLQVAIRRGQLLRGDPLHRAEALAHALGEVVRPLLGGRAQRAAPGGVGQP